MSSRDEKLSLTWYDLGEPFLSHRLPGGNPERPHGVATVLIPADGARLTVNGQLGGVLSHDRGTEGPTVPVRLHSLSSGCCPTRMRFPECIRTNLRWLLLM